MQDEQHSQDLARKQADLAELGIQVSLGHPLERLPQVELIVVSPGIRWDHPALAQARSEGISVVGEAEWAWRSLQHLPWVGITGTNGKTTTTALIGAMFAAAGYRAPTCGNIGLPLCQIGLEVLQGQQDPQWIVAELSSYQLEAADTLLQRSVGDLSSSQDHIGVWTTLTPDHLERHGTVESYAAIKARLLDRVSQRVLNGDDPYLYGIRQRWPQTLWTSCDRADAPIRLRGDQIWVGDRPWVSLGSFTTHLPGRHNLQNLLMATAAAYRAGIEAEAVARAIDTFEGVPHRLQTVRVWQGIRFINDSKATNYDAAVVGLQAVDPPIIVIAGGQPKQGDDSLWLEVIRQKVAGVLLIGAAGPQFAQRLAQIRYTDVQIVDTLDVAVPRAFEWAQSLKGSHREVAVVLSPACASFDQYPNFERRGEHFQICCHHLVG